MPRPPVLIRTDDLALSEILRADVDRAGGVPVDRGDAPVVIVGARTVDALVDASADASAEASIIAVHTGPLGLDEQLEILAHQRIDHYIHESTVDHVLYPTIRKILSGDIFGLDKYLPAAPTRRLRIDSYAGRGLALDAVMRAANALNLPRVVREQMSAVGEELIINALYEAPADAADVKLFADVGPRDRLTRRSPQPVSLRYASTDQFFAIAVRDRYGRIRKDVVLDAVQSAAREGTPASRILGQGRGLHNVLSKATAVSINVAAGSVCEVVCTFAREPRTHGAFGFFAHRDDGGIHA